MEEAPLSILPADWDPQKAGDRLLASLATITPPEVLGAHDAAMVMRDGWAYVVAEVNDESEGEAASRPEIYSTLTVLETGTGRVAGTFPIARAGQAFANHQLPHGACFVPRIADLGDRLRCFFTVQQPGVAQASAWYRDFDPVLGVFSDSVHPLFLETAAGVEPMTPAVFHRDAARSGFQRPPVDHGLYLFDSFKVVDGEVYIALNNYPGKQNALARVQPSWDTFRILGHYNRPEEVGMSESAVQRLPDGCWLAICRCDGGDRNYRFTESRDGGVSWTEATQDPAVQDGTNSKPTFDCFAGIYFLGWQDAERVGGVHRSVFNLELSRDGRSWERCLRIESDAGFQYPTFAAHGGRLFVCATQGHPGVGGKRRIVFGEVPLPAGLRS